MRPVNIKGYEKYHVNEEGVVVNTSTGRVLKTDLTKAGYKRVTMMVDSVKFRISVHRLVALTYLGDSYREGLVVNHKDGVKTNNHWRNLEWVTSSQNRKHAFEKGLTKDSKRMPDHIAHEICKAISEGVPAGVTRKKFKLPKHRYDDIRTRRSYRDISAGYKW